MLYKNWRFIDWSLFLGHGGNNGKEKSLINKSNGNNLKKFRQPKLSTTPADVETATTSGLMLSGFYEDYAVVKKAYKGEINHFDYSSEEYKSWMYDRRLQNKLKRERSEKYQQLPTSMQQQQRHQQRQQQRLKPISSRDRAKLALSESRQKMAQSQHGPALE